jgi:hypothetical protein
VYLTLTAPQQRLASTRSVLNPARKKFAASTRNAKYTGTSLYASVHQAILAMPSTSAQNFLHERKLTILAIHHLAARIFPAKSSMTELLFVTFAHRLTPRTTRNADPSASAILIVHLTKPVWDKNVSILALVPVDIMLNVKFTIIIRFVDANMDLLEIRSSSARHQLPMKAQLHVTT